MSTVFPVRFAWYQFIAFLQRMPEYLDRARARLLPWLSGTLGVELNLDPYKS